MTPDHRPFLLAQRASEIELPPPPEDRRRTRRSNQRNLLYKESSTWEIAVGLILIAVVIFLLGIAFLS